MHKQEVCRICFCTNFLGYTSCHWYRRYTSRTNEWIYFSASKFAHNFTGFADLQYRGVSYRIDGIDSDFMNLGWKQNYNFFNPKGGFTFAPDDYSRIYASVAVAHREPSRSDIKESIKSGSANRLKAEQLVDVEVGYRYSSENLHLSANLYFMEYDNQLVATGKLSDVGYVIKENIPSSYRRGIELVGAVAACHEVVQTGFDFIAKLAKPAADSIHNRSPLEKISNILY